MLLSSGRVLLEPVLSISNWDVAKKLVSPEPTSEKSPKSKTRANTTLTALTGLLLFALLAIEGVTVPFVGRLFTLHVFIGWVLVPPILLKISSTSYRFIMYYSGNERYVKAGPPKPLLRILGPVIVLFTTLLMWSGVEMVLLGPNSSSTRLWSTIHKASFIIWFVIMAVHVLSYFLKAGSFAWPDIAPRSGSHSSKIPGRTIRLVLVVTSLIIGIFLGFHEWPHATSWIAQFHTRKRFG